VLRDRQALRLVAALAFKMVPAGRRSAAGGPGNDTNARLSLPIEPGRRLIDVSGKRANQRLSDDQEPTSIAGSSGATELGLVPGLVRRARRADRSCWPCDVRSVGNYIHALRKCGYKDAAIEPYLRGLGAALRVLAPDRSFTWLHPWNLCAANIAGR